MKLFKPKIGAITLWDAKSNTCHAYTRVYQQPIGPEADITSCCTSETILNYPSGVR